MVILSSMKLIRHIAKGRDGLQVLPAPRLHPAEFRGCAPKVGSRRSASGSFIRPIRPIGRFGPLAPPSNQTKSKKIKQNKKKPNPKKRGGVGGQPPVKAGQAHSLIH